jgi:archaemetzincin
MERLKRTGGTAAWPRLPGALLLAALGLWPAGGAGCGRESPSAPPPELRPARVFRPPAPPAADGATTPAQLAFAVDDVTDAVTLPEPGPGDWLAVHPERSESFHSYVESAPRGRTEQRRELALVPIGPFDDRQQELLARAAEFTALWFDTPTWIAGAVPLPGPPDRRGRSRGRSWEQYLTGPFLREILPDRLPPSAIALLGITMADLYPGPDWNFVFGQADLRRGVGIYSLVRFAPEFRGEARTPEAEWLELRRTLQVVVHELGHVFGLRHCANFTCNMNGSNSLAETDRAPLHLCPACLRKLQWNLGFDVLARYDALAAFLERVGLGEDAAWFRLRAGRIRGSASGEGRADAAAERSGADHGAGNASASSARLTRTSRPSPSRSL